MIRTHKMIFAVGIIFLFIGASAFPAFSGDLSRVHYVKNSVKADDINNWESLSNNKVKNSFQRIEPGFRLPIIDSTQSQFNAYRQRIQKLLFPHSFHRSQPIPIDGVEGEWDIIVPDEYSSIQAAIDNVGSQNGYRIFVRSGTYHENIVISTDGVILHGENKETTIINGNNEGHVVTLDSSYNNMSGFTFRNSGSNSAGLYFDVSSGNQIFDNKIMNNQGSGLQLFRSHANNITENIINDNGQHGIHVNASSLANTITQNQVQNNQESGVLIDNASRSSLIAGNLIESNNVGVKITDVSENNIVHHNQFIGNSQNGFDDYHNFWDDTVGEGNYWDDYTGIDSDDDGIGDTPYELFGGDNVDRYPLINTPAIESFSFQNQGLHSDDSASFSNDEFSFSGNTIIVPDDYPSIQEAIDHAVDGDTIQVKPGLYYENVVIDKTVNIVGCTMDFNWTNYNGDNFTLITGNQFDHIFNIIADNVILSGFIIDQTNLGYSGLRIKSDNVEIINNYILCCGDGIHVRGSNYKIVNNKIIQCNFGIYSDKSHDGMMKDNLFVGNSDGICIWSSNDLVIQNNLIEISFFNGFLQLTSNRINIKKNRVSKNYENNFQFFNSNDLLIKENNVGICGKYSIFLFNSNDNFIEENDIDDSLMGIFLNFLSDNNVIINNTISYCEVGMMFYRSNNNSITQNNIYNDSIGSYFNYANSNYIDNNTISDCFDGVVLEYSSVNTIFNNSLRNNNAVNIGLQDYCNNNLILNNKIISSKQIGIFLGYCNNVTIIENQISDNQIGLALIDSNNIHINCNNFVDNEELNAFFSNLISDFNVISKIIFIFNNDWNGNYWDDWLSFFPRPITGDIYTDENIYADWFNIDWHPARKPYVIRGNL